MSFLNTLSVRFLESMEQRTAARVYEHIYRLDADLLERAGISPELLAQGPAAYPWRDDAVKAQTSVITKMAMSDTATIRLAIAELQAFSDAELHDLGISRGDIAEVVRSGRPGVDYRPVTAPRQQAA